ncbi:MAG: molybdate ABC transporter substrate-binding protein [Epsilonproteobacteria bacterium]|nr:molybdate ABC transporter substrate-binding protein [Campylobacterota bacterium]
MTKIIARTVALILTPILAFGAEAKIAAAADLVYCFPEVKKAFEKRYPNENVSFSFGSSGKAMTQIVNGAPYDMYFSANMGYVQKLKNQGFIATDPKPYAYGRVGMFVLNSSAVDISKGIGVLLDPSIKKIAIADPAHAPYGVAAVESLKSQGIYDKIKSKLVLGENVSQATQFVSSGAADIGIIPISLGYSDKLKKEGKFLLFPAKWHNDIVQGYGITTVGASNKTAKLFSEYVSSPEARKIFKQYGFVLPNEE